MSRPTLDGAKGPASRMDVRKVAEVIGDPSVETQSDRPWKKKPFCVAGDEDVLAKSGHGVLTTAARIIEPLTEEHEVPEKPVARLRSWLF